jgi:hypothetical protein
MWNFEIRLLSPSGRVAEIYALDGESVEFAVMKAKLLLDSHQEFVGAQVSWDMETFNVESITLH